MFAYKHLVWHLVALSVSSLLLNLHRLLGPEKKKDFKRQKARRGGGGKRGMVEVGMEDEVEPVKPLTGSFLLHLILH